MLKQESPVLAVDPGREKCGLALVAADGAVLRRGIFAPDELKKTVEQWWREVEATGDTIQIVVGDATSSGALLEELRQRLPGASISAVDERGSTLEARDLYWRQNPPRGWRRILPLSLQVPPEPVDDFAAVVVARRFLQCGVRNE